MNLKKINFRQPKYIFPLIVSVPIGCLLYLIGDMFGGTEEEKPTDFINTNLPAANVNSSQSKLAGMQARYNDKDNLFSAVDGFREERQEKESIDMEYSDDELEKIMQEAEQKRAEREQVDQMQRNVDRAQQRLFGSPSYPNNSSGNSTDYMAQYDDRMDQIQRRQQERYKQLMTDPEEEERKREQAETERLAKEEAQRKAAEETPHEVIKVSEVQTGMFNTVDAFDSQHVDAPLIKAMIDKTTKSSEGTRLRFKLLDDVIIKDIKLPKGTYLYGTVSGFGNQRVKATISNVLVGSTFLKVDLSVYDLDGMEGFYVPASSFREFMTDAASGVANANVNFNNNSGGSSGFNAQMLALQALQNIYSAGSNAISKNIKKNKAKIKYNTIVYLINSQNVK